MHATDKQNYLEIRHDATGLLNISNQYTLAFDADRFHKIVVLLQGTTSEASASDIPADLLISLNLRTLRGINLIAVLRLINLCRRYRVSHLLTHRYKPAFIAGLVTFFYKPVSVFAVLHGNHQFDRPSRRLAAKLFFSRSNFKIIGVSQTTQADIKRQLPNKNDKDIISLPNCIDVEKTLELLLDRNDAKAQLNVQNYQFVLGHIGRLSPAKDQFTLLRAFHHAKPHMPGSVLLLIGGGRLERQLKDEAKRLQIDNDVIFTGSINKAWQLMKAFDCFVATSVSEGFGLVIVEAMVARIPLIATAIGSFTEIVGQIVDLAPCGDYRQIGNQMIANYTMPATQRQALGETLFQRVQQEFSVPRFRRRVQHLYNTTA